ncbi:MAG: CbtA family protein [Chloroflexi bacterium]|nr:CbtA family protein [Chloroflexota bacterium]
MRALLLRGMLSGVCAGVLALAFAVVVGEPAINRAIAFEEASAAEHEHATPAADTHDASAEAKPVSRGMQRGVGLAAGLLALGAVFGGIVAIVFAVTRGRLGALSDRGSALLVALLAFCALYLLPFLKYPANPPAASDPGTIEARTAAYAGALALSVAITASAVVLQHWLARQRGAWDATLLATVAGVIAFALVALALPMYSELPEGFPGETLWRFRLASLGTQLVLWLGIGLVFGLLTERAGSPARKEQSQ